MICDIPSMHYSESSCERDRVFIKNTFGSNQYTPFTQSSTHLLAFNRVPPSHFWLEIWYKHGGKLNRSLKTKPQVFAMFYVIYLRHLHIFTITKLPVHYNTDWNIEYTCLCKATTVLNTVYTLKYRNTFMWIPDCLHHLNNSSLYHML